MVASDEVAIHCELESFPIAQIEWLFNNALIGPNNELSATAGRTTMAGTNVQTSTLALSRTDPDSAGTYTCNATNERGSVTADTTLIVHGNFSIICNLSEIKHVTCEVMYVHALYWTHYNNVYYNTVSAI